MREAFDGASFLTRYPEYVTRKSKFIIKERRTREEEETNLSELKKKFPEDYWPVLEKNFWEDFERYNFWKDYEEETFALMKSAMAHAYGEFIVNFDADQIRELNTSIYLKASWFQDKVVMLERKYFPRKSVFDKENQKQ